MSLHLTSLREWASDTAFAVATYPLSLAMRLYEATTQKKEHKK